MTTLRTFWAERVPRERLLLGVMAVLAGAMFLWLGVARPLAAARVRAEARLAEASDQAGLIAARRANAGGGGKQVAVADPAGLVRASGAAAGFTLTRAEGDGAGGVTVAIPSAKAPALFAWLVGLERQGLRVATIDLRANPDGSLAADIALKAAR